MISLLFLAALGSVAAHDFTICPSVTDHFHVSSVTLSPDPVKGGVPLNVSFVGKPDADMASGKATLLVKFLGVQIASLDFDVCSDLGMNCPLKANEEVTGFLSYSIPSLPGGLSGLSADVQLTVTDGSGAKVTCVDVKAKLTTASSGNLRASAPSASVLTRKGAEYLFAAWMAEHQVDMPTAAEFVKRLDIFTENFEAIYQHNQDPSSTYTKAMNQFGHYTPEEFKAKFTGFKRPADPIFIPRTTFSFPWSRKSELADSVDWVAEGAVNTPMNQGSCGSCWTFSTTGALEGAYYVKNSELVSFSKQQLVSCDTTDDGCDGGQMDYAFKWIKDNGGLCTEADYPYASSSGTAPSCESSCTAVSGSAPSSYVDVSETESALMAAVSKQPVSIAIEADQSAFQFYSTGVMTGTCGTSLDHGVLLVGYGTMDGTDYWKVKNSWGTTWGVDGYINVERGNSQSGGLCGILLSASYPTL